MKRTHLSRHIEQPEEGFFGGGGLDDLAGEAAFDEVAEDGDRLGEAAGEDDTLPVATGPQSAGEAGVGLGHRFEGGA